MKIAHHLCKLFSPKYIIAFIALSVVSLPTYAYSEVVDLSPGASPPLACGSTCTERVVYRTYVVQKHHVRKHARHHRVRHYIPRCHVPVCRVEMDEITEASPCSCRVKHRSPGYKSIVYFRSGPTTMCGTYGYYNESACYSPDMSTGDDDAMVYPDMNIDE